MSANGPKNMLPNVTEWFRRISSYISKTHFNVVVNTGGPRAVIKKNQDKRRDKKPQISSDTERAEIYQTINFYLA